MEIKLNALLLRATDYGENDKMVTLLTAEEGRISAAMKGVRKPSAKLRFAAQPFCFGEYVLSKNADRYTVIGCSEIESFFDLRYDVDKFYAACAVCETAEAISYEGQGAGETFAKCVRALSDICLGDEGAELVKFLVFALRQAGYAINCNGCFVCGGEPFGERVRFDMDEGAFTCYDCGTGAAASFSTYEILKCAGDAAFDFSQLTRDKIKRALRLLKEYAAYKTGSRFSSLSEYIRLI